MPEVIEERSGHLLVREDDGSVNLITLSPFNRLLYDHGLFGLLKAQDESLALSDDDWTVSIEPQGGNEYVVDIEDSISPTLKPHEKSRLVDALVDAYDTDADPDPEPIVSATMALRDYDVIPSLVDDLADIPSFDHAVEVTEDGWLIHDMLLLTYNNEFVNTRTDSHTRSGDSVRPTTKEGAYEIRFRTQRTLDESYTDRDTEARFIARAKWAVDNVGS